MTTMKREDFVGRLGDVARALPDAAKHDAMRAVADVIAAWDAQAADVARLTAEVEALRKNSWHHPACRACAADRVYQPGMTDDQVRAGVEKLCGQRFDDEVWEEVARAWKTGIQHMHEIVQNRGLPVDDVPHVETTGVPLTLENAHRARVVEVPAGTLHGGYPVDGLYTWNDDADKWGRHTGMPWYASTDQILAMGATVLAWRTP